MALLAIEIHDAGIRAKLEGEERSRADSPGYAVIEGAKLLTGEAARGRARLRPRHVDSRFWCELDTTPLSAPFEDGVSRADLAHAHLSSIWREARTDVDDAILVLPGAFSEAQLGLLLGIARSCAIPVRGLVDSAVAACPHETPPTTMLHVDLQLHRAVVTELACAEVVSRRAIRVAADAGLATLHDIWVRRIAERFVRETRFDPLHDARTEQALYDALHAVLAELGSRDRADALIDASGVSHTIELTRATMISAVAATYDTVAQLVGQFGRAGRPTTILLSERCAALPGLAQRLEELGEATTCALHEAAALDGALRNRDQIRSGDGSFRLVTELRRTPSPDARETSTRPAIEPPTVERDGLTPTHLVHRATAYPITTDPLRLGVAVSSEGRALHLPAGSAGISREHCTLRLVEGRAWLEEHSRHGSFLNGRRVEGKLELIAGDRLRLGNPGIEMLLVRAVSEDGSTPRT